MGDDWCTEKLNELRVPETRLAALAVINSRLNEQPDDSATEDVLLQRLLTSPELFACLDKSKEFSLDENLEQKKLINDIKEKCLKRIKIDPCLDETINVLRRALTSSHKHIRAKAIDAVLKVLREKANQCELKPLPNNDFFFYVLDELKQSESDCYSDAINILSLTLLPHIKEQRINEKILAMLKENDIVRCRLYELGVQIGQQSTNTLISVEFILDAAIAELDNDDVLLQSTVLEILVPLAEHAHGFQFLERRRVFDVLSDRVRLVEQLPLVSLLIPSIMKFFGKIARIYPRKMMTQYENMVLFLFTTLREGDMNLLPTAMDTLANLADKPEGKLVLDERFSTAIREVFEVYSGYLKNLPVELKIRLFNTLEAIFTKNNDVTATAAQNESDVLKKWLRYLTNDNDLKLMLDYSLTPFADLKLAALGFVKALCTYEWGVVALNNTGGFIEYLLDRRVETVKDVKFQKWEIIRQLADSSVFDAQQQIQLTRFVNNGPYYLSTEMSVAFERTN